MTLARQLRRAVHLDTARPCDIVSEAQSIVEESEAEDKSAIRDCGLLQRDREFTVLFTNASGLAPDRRPALPKGRGVHASDSETAFERGHVLQVHDETAWPHRGSITT